MERLARLAWILLVALPLGAGCGDDAGGSRYGDGGPTLPDDDDAGADTSPAPVAVTITAADGGEISHGGAALDIPAGALADDTEITIAVVDKAGLPDEADIASEVYDLGPDGTTFEQPVTLTIDFDACATPDGMVGAIAYLDGDTWTLLADSRVSGNSATATTDHFTYFAIVWTADTGGSQTAGMCETFTACGSEPGALVGTWTVSASCITVPPNLLGDPNDPQNPFANCDGITTEGNVDITGTVTFGADMSYETDLTFALDIKSLVPTSCVPQDASCMDLGGTTECGACVIGMPSSNTEMAMGTYETSGNTLTTTEAGMTSPPVEYCVEGTTLTVRSPGSDTSPEVIYSAEKQ